MKIPWLKVAQIEVEFIWDFATGKLEPKREVKGWSAKDGEPKAKAQRCAGHESEPKCQ